MLYTILLTLHSFVRWLVLVSLIIALFRILRGWISKSPFMKKDEKVHKIAISMLHLQFTLGVMLYSESCDTLFFDQF